MTDRVMLDPTAELNPPERQRLPRLKSLDGKTVGLLDISKARGNVFLDRIESKLTESGATVERYAKPTFTRPAPTALAQAIAAECDLVIEALAD